MFRDIYPEETAIRLIPNRVFPKPDRLVECKLLDALIFVDLQAKVHVTLYDKRDDYNFFVNRFPDIDSNVSRTQSISTFFGKIVRLFRLNTHPEGFLENVGSVAAYLVFYKRYLKEELRSLFSRFLRTQKGNPRLFGLQSDLLSLFDYFLQTRTEKLAASL